LFFPLLHLQAETAGAVVAVLVVAVVMTAVLAAAVRVATAAVVMTAVLAAAVRVVIAAVVMTAVLAAAVRVVIAVAAVAHLAVMMSMGRMMALHRLPQMILLAAGNNWLRKIGIYLNFEAAKSALLLGSYLTTAQHKLIA
jgi:hypothetical protein